MIERTVERDVPRPTRRNRFLEVTYQNGDKEILYFKDFSSGAMIENIVRRAKKLAIKRVIAGGAQGHPHRRTSSTRSSRSTRSTRTCRTPPTPTTGRRSRARRASASSSSARSSSRRRRRRGRSGDRAGGDRAVPLSDRLRRYVGPESRRVGSTPWPIPQDLRHRDRVRHRAARRATSRTRSPRRRC